ncbi:hypothetical protein [Photorhabdus temperata]|uniref:hypothetical protein n=1 Tax=Photorhabdus temperata TaxID=574560 RepID=UPI001E60282F|nr:hypothetical protein [Photorhabdus temperata]
MLPISASWQPAQVAAAVARHRRTLRSQALAARMQPWLGQGVRHHCPSTDDRHRP